MERGVPIRSISRCIAVLQAINQHGSPSLMEIARMAKLPYPTAYRIMQTLLHEGLIEAELTRKRYRATGLAHTLSQGFHNRDRLVTQARPFIVGLTRKVGWAIAITTRIGQSMVIRDNTQDLTALTSNLYPPGFSMPLLECASGRVYVAHLDDDERKAVLDVIEKQDSRSPSLAAFKRDDLVTKIREDGYAVYERVQDAAPPEKMTSISVPLRDDAHLAGSLALIYFSAAMRVDDAVERYVTDLKATADLIGRAIGGAPPPVDAKTRRPARAQASPGRALPA